MSHFARIPARPPVDLVGKGAFSVPPASPLPAVIRWLLLVLHCYRTGLSIPVILAVNQLYDHRGGFWRLWRTTGINTVGTRIISLGGVLLVMAISGVISIVS